MRLAQMVSRAVHRNTARGTHQHRPLGLLEVTSTLGIHTPTSIGSLSPATPGVRLGIGLGMGLLNLRLADPMAIFTSPQTRIG